MCGLNRLRQKLGHCNCPSFKINRPQIHNSCKRNFNGNSDGEIQKHINFLLQKDQARLLISNMYKVAMHNRIDDSVIDLSVHWTCVAPCVLNFSG